MSTTTIETLTTEQLAERNQALSDTYYANLPKDRAEKSAAWRELHIAQSANERLWQAWLRKDNLEDSVGDRAAQRLFDIAWEDGHSEGYQRVAERYEELAEIVNLAVRGE
jgi:hypothetical protein